MYLRESETEVAEPPIHQADARKGLRALFVHFRLVDYLTCGYLAVVGLLILFFHRGVPFWPYLVLANAATIAFLVGFINLAERRRSKVLRFFRDAYPIFLYTFMFKEISLIINVFFPFWFEQHLINLDRVLFGGQPTVWVQRLYRPWLTEYMAFAYWSYYILLPLTALVLYFRKKRALFHSYVFHLSLTLYVCYLSYPFLTARGPHETLAHLHLSRETVGFFDQFVRVIQENAAISGAAFPSSHVTAVIISWIFLFRWNRLVGWITLPLILSLGFSVVYLQYHYAVDPLAAVLLVALLYPFGLYLERRFSPATLSQIESKEVRSATKL